MNKILEVKNLTFNYADTMVFKDISLELNEEEFVGISGPNGAGKSTLLKLILGQLKPLSGKISLFGEKVSDFKDWQKVGYISQKMVDLNASFPASVLEVVISNMYKSIGFGLPARKKHKEKALEVLNLVGAAHLVDKRIGELSGGQQQRVFLARALVNDPEMLILDEATSGIDAQSQDKFYELLQNLREKKNISILMVSHDMLRIHDNVDKLYYLLGNSIELYDLHNDEDHERLNRIIHGAPHSFGERSETYHAKMYHDKK